MGESQKRSSELRDVHPITSLLSTICCLLLPLLLRATTLVGRRRRRETSCHPQDEQDNMTRPPPPPPPPPTARNNPNQGRVRPTLSLSLFTKHVFPLYIGFFSPPFSLGEKYRPLNAKLFLLRMILLLSKFVFPLPALLLL